MQKGLFAATLLAALAFVGGDSKEAHAGSPFFLSVGGPRGGLSIGTGYGFGYGGGGFYRRGPVAPRGVTLGYRGGFSPYYRPLPPARGYYVPPRRACDFGYYGY